MNRIEDRSPERILADAICNCVLKLEVDIELPGGSEHNLRARKLGIEGDNGVACPVCEIFARSVMEEQKRISAAVAGCSWRNLIEDMHVARLRRGER